MLPPILSSLACSPLFSHLSPQTFCNPLYVGSLVPSYILMAIAAAWAYLLSGGSAQNLRRFLLCKFLFHKGYGECHGSLWVPGLALGWEESVSGAGTRASSPWVPD